MIPVAGAALIRLQGEIIGCVGVAGDPSADNDDLAAHRGIAAVAELTADFDSNKSRGWIDLHNLLRINGVWKFTK
jgi:hypothetical protein